MQMHKITATTFSVICCFTRAFLPPPPSPPLSLCVSLRVALLIHLCVVDLFFTNSQSVQRLLPFLVFLNLRYRHTFKADNLFGVRGLLSLSSAYACSYWSECMGCAFGGAVWTAVCGCVLAAWNARAGRDLHFSQRWRSLLAPLPATEHTHSAEHV